MDGDKPDQDRDEDFDFGPEHVEAPGNRGERPLNCVGVDLPGETWSSGSEVRGRQALPLAFIAYHLTSGATAQKACARYDRPAVA